MLEMELAKAKGWLGTRRPHAAMKPWCRTPHCRKRHSGLQHKQGWEVPSCEIWKRVSLKHTFQADFTYSWQLRHDDEEDYHLPSVTESESWLSECLATPTLSRTRTGVPRTTLTNNNFRHAKYLVFRSLLLLLFNYVSENNLETLLSSRPNWFSYSP